MSVLDQKRKVFGNIAALNTLTTGLPKLKISSNLPSMNNGGDSITFLTDLIKVLIGYEELVGTLVDILVNQLTLVEKEVKKELKRELKSIVSCGVNPSIPAFLKSTGSGIVIPVNKVDFFDLFKVDPNTIAGNTLYNDIQPNLTDSSDLNTFLYGALQDEGVTKSWGPVNNKILDFTFFAQDVNNVNPNNSFVIRTNPNYDNKTLTELNNNFIDSISLFNSQNIINNIIDLIFGSISSIGKTKKQLENEAKINNLIDCIASSDDDDVIDDNYFVYTNEEIQEHQQEADVRKNGIRKLECCGNVAASIPINFLTDMNTQLSGATSTAQQSEIISNNITAMANQTTVNSVDSSDHMSIKLNFIQNLINNLIKVIVGTILSPKVLMIFIINYKIIYGQNSSYNDATEFISKNRSLFQSMIKKIGSLIIKVLLALAIKLIIMKVSEQATNEQIKRGKAQLAQLLSLIGVSPNTLRLINGI